MATSHLYIYICLPAWLLLLALLLLFHLKENEFYYICSSNLRCETEWNWSRFAMRVSLLILFEKKKKRISFELIQLFSMFKCNLSQVFCSQCHKIFRTNSSTFLWSLSHRVFSYRFSVLCWCSQYSLAQCLFVVFFSLFTWTGVFFCCS